jgi:cytochrome c553
LPRYIVEDRRSGYTYLSEENQRLQDDDFANPGLLWVEHGRALWHQIDGTPGTSCARCHGDAAASMRLVRPRYPRFEAQRGKLMNLEQQINDYIRGSVDDTMAEAGPDFPVDQIVATIDDIYERSLALLEDAQDNEIHEEVA